MYVCTVWMCSNRCIVRISLRDNLCYFSNSQMVKIQIACFFVGVIFVTFVVVTFLPSAPLPSELCNFHINISSFSHEKLSIFLLRCKAFSDAQDKYSFFIFSYHSVLCVLQYIRLLCLCCTSVIFLSTPVSHVASLVTFSRRDSEQTLHFFVAHPTPSCCHRHSSLHMVAESHSTKYATKKKWACVCVCVCVHGRRKKKQQRVKWDVKVTLWFMQRWCFN